MSIIMNDYLAGFLGLPRDGNAWAMNAFDVGLYQFILALQTMLTVKLSPSRTATELLPVVKETTLASSSTFFIGYVS